MPFSPTQPRAAAAQSAVDRDQRVARWVRGVLVANLIAQIGIVVTGGLVRLTGSGLGCPTWPECVPGSYTPVLNQPQGWHKDIEFGNRLLTTVVTVTAIAALFAVISVLRSPVPPAAEAAQRPVGRRRLLLLGAAPLIGVAAQAVLGGLTVLTGLNPGLVAAHFLLSMALVAASTVLLLQLTAPRPAGVAVRSEIRVLAYGLAAVAGVVLTLGTVVTGSGPHSGDAHAPARFGFDPRTVAWLHADAVWLFVGLVVALLLALRLADAPARARRNARLLLLVTLLQGAIGYSQYATGLPIGLVSLHTLGAALLVVAVTAVVHSVAAR